MAPDIIRSIKIDMLPRHLVMLVGFNFVFAVALAVTKVGMQTLPPFLFTGIRFLAYGLMLVPFLKWHKGRMGTLFLIAMSTGAFGIGFIYLGINIAGDLSSVVVATQLGIPFTTIFALIFLRERIGWRRWTGMGLAFGGVMMISFDSRVLGYIEGILFGVLGALVGAGAFVLMRKSKDIGVFEMQAWIAMFSWPVLLVVSWYFEGAPLPLIQAAHWQAWAAIAFTVVGSNFVAHAGMYWLLQRYEASLLSPFGVLGTIFTVMIGVFFLGDQLTLVMILGMIVTLVGVSITAVRQHQSPEKEYYDQQPLA